MVDAKKVKEMVAKKSSKFVGNIAGGGKASSQALSYMSRTHFGQGRATCLQGAGLH